MVCLAGVWNLLSFEYIINGTVVARPNGPTPLGKIAIMPEGWISVEITTPGAPLIPDGRKWADGTDHEIAEIARPYVSYCGRWTTVTLDDGQMQLHTNVSVSLDPEWSTRLQRRNVTIVEENGKTIMELRPVGPIPFNLPGISGNGTSVLTWDRQIISNTCSENDH